MQNILLVEDSAEFQLVVKRTLTAAHAFNLICTSSAEEALIETAKTKFDLILLDIGLPGASGLELCASLQQNEKTRDTPVVFLTGKDEVADKVAAFSLGADDYIVKPFNPLEFRARVEAKLVKARRKSEAEEALDFGPLHIDATTLKTSVKSETGELKDLGLTPIEFKLLTHLARNKERVFTREQLLSAVWGNDVHVYDRTVDAHVCSLRKKLGSQSHLVESVPGTGYRFSLSARKKTKAAA